MPIRAWLLSLLVFALPLHAAESGVESWQVGKPVAALIIDDLGNNLSDGLRALNLPGRVTLAILPRTPYGYRFATAGWQQGNEVMMHQPMEALNGKTMGPGGLSAQMNREMIAETLRTNLMSVPHARGINNHMGSLLTMHPDSMRWVMDELKWRGLYFVDSKTSPQSVAQKVAQAQQVTTAGRNIFLDSEQDEAAIEQQFQRFIAQARVAGHSLAIAHPYPETLRVLERRLPTLEAQGIRLVAVSELLQAREERRERLWQASLFPSQTAAKNSKQ